MIEPIGVLVRRLEQNYTTGNTSISKYVDFDQYENINKIEAYLNSRHTTGDVDALGREKPFFNIVTAAKNIWYRATDLDRKDIRIKATKEQDYISAFVATCYLQDWMRRENFGAFLNKWGMTLAEYGSAVTKWVEKDGTLHASVVPWNRIICDTIDFENNPVIEKLEYTPAQLLKSKYDRETVKKLIETRASREDLNQEKRDNKADYITLYEIHGELSVAQLKAAQGQDYDEADEDEFVQQMHVVSYVESKERKGEFEDFTLYSGREKNPYLITHLLETEGRTQSIGAVEHLFEAQWMTNHNAKLIKDQLDLASQLIFQTSDGSFTGRNVLKSIVSGDILIHSVNEPITQLANQSHDITALQSFGAQWQNLAKEITATPDAIRANTQPSGTAYRLQQLLTDEAHSLFEVMAENKGLYLEEMLRKYVLPHIRKKLDNKKEIAATLNANGIREFDAMFVPNEAIRIDNQQIKQTVLSGQIAENLDRNALEQDIQRGLDRMGGQRFIKPSEVDSKTWKEVFKDLEWEVEVPVTNESSDKNATLTTLTTVLQTVASNPGVLQDPNMKTLFNQILEEAGSISPVKFRQGASSQPQLPQPQPGQPGQPTNPLQQLTPQQ